MSRALTVISLLVASIGAFGLELPSRSERLRLFDQWVSEIERLDGEALLVRKNRKLSFRQLTDRLRQSVAKANSLRDWAFAYYQLDQAYPNLHAFLDINDPVVASQLGSKLRFSIPFVSSWLAKDEVRYYLQPQSGFLGGLSPMDVRTGDELVAINDRPMSYWQNLNFEYCKHPLKSQCDYLLPRRFIDRVFARKIAKQVSFSVRRGSKTFKVPVSVYSENFESGFRFSGLSPVSSSSIGFSQSQKQKQKQKKVNYERLCRNQTGRYPGFKRVYTGNRACVYQSVENRGEALLRITSFNYRDLPSDEPIRSVDDEIEALYRWWRSKANWQHLIIDVIDNHGGTLPIGYYQLLFREPFQEQYVKFRKVPEMLDRKLRDSVFWGSPGQEKWFQNILADGDWNRTQARDFLSLIPMFCANEPNDCRQGMFDPFNHPFRGRVSVMLNQWCVSSCDGFVYEIKDYFAERARFFGAPQSADTAYSRLSLHLVKTKKGQFKIQVEPIRQNVEGSVFSQTIAFTRSFTKDGEVVSGVPVEIDGFVPRKYNEDSATWTRKVLSRVLKK